MQQGTQQRVQGRVDSRTGNKPRQPHKQHDRHGQAGVRAGDSTGRQEHGQAAARAGSNTGMETSTRQNVEHEKRPKQDGQGGFWVVEVEWEVRSTQGRLTGYLE